jgi:hypothetical protein
MSLKDEIDSRRKSIHTDGYPMSIGELASLYNDGELDIHPEFQRFYRWTPEQKAPACRILPPRNSSPLHLRRPAARWGLGCY